jgi:hypothetical protein|tara:strand:- start:1987 stop:2130 length:144 start_codon:yes stop_codon:yes gene_type:complete
MSSGKIGLLSVTYRLPVIDPEAKSNGRVAGLLGDDQASYLTALAADA